MKMDADDKQGSPIPSATVILLREQSDTLEVLLLRRNLGRDIFAGAWVFPGGTIESGDGQVAPVDAWPAAARRAGVRELKEETDLNIRLQDLVPFACWTSPACMPRRFRTWFFLAAAPSGPVRLSRQEASAYCWLAPQQVLKRHGAKGMRLFPPTWVSLYELAGRRTVAQVLDMYARRPPKRFNPRVLAAGADMCFIYEEDAAYADLDVDRPGPRHRLWTSAHGWRYERKA